MEILYLLVPISVVVVFLIALAFWWSLRNGQFDDLEGPAYRILMDDDKTTAAKPGVEAPGEADVPRAGATPPRGE